MPKLKFPLTPQYKQVPASFRLFLGFLGALSIVNWSRDIFSSVLFLHSSPLIHKQKTKLRLNDGCWEPESLMWDEEEIADWTLLFPGRGRSRSWVSNTVAMIPPPGLKSANYFQPSTHAGRISDCDTTKQQSRKCPCQTQHLSNIVHREEGQPLEVSHAMVARTTRNR